PLVIETDEGLADGAGHRRVHGEARAGPVAGRAHHAQLLEDRAARLFFPLEDPLDELLAAELLAGLALALEQALDDDLGGDARVVRARQPQGVVPLHTLVPNEDVLEGRTAGVTHVEGARDVRGRDRDHVRRAIVVRVRARLEVPLGLPALVPMGLGLAGRVRLRHALGVVADVFHGAL